MLPSDVQFCLEHEIAFMPTMQVKGRIVCMQNLIQSHTIDY